MKNSTLQNFICLSIFFLFHPNFGYTQNCDCNEYLYLNDEVTSTVHKFLVDPVTGAPVEIGNPWYQGIDRPHGSGTDINGNLYIGEVNNSYTETVLQKFNCAGELIDGNYFTYSRFFTNASSDGNNTLYLWGMPFDNASNRQVTALDLCTGDQLACNRTGINGWGFFIDGDRFWGTADDCNNPIWFGNTADLTNDCDAIVPTTTFPAAGNYCSSGHLPRGIYVDDQGFVYVVYGQTPAGGEINWIPFSIFIVKYNPDGTIAAQSAIDNDPTDGGWDTSRGVVASENGLIYVGSSDGDPAAGTQSCIIVLEDDGNGNLVLVSQINNPPNVDGQSKGIAIQKECCPTSSMVAIDTTLCVASVNDVLFLQDLFGCDGTICEGLWTPDAGNTSLTYNSCDNSVTVNALDACSNFTLASNGTGANAICGAFTIDLQICFGTPPQLPAISITDNDCATDAAGTINIDTDCTTGDTLEWSTDGGTTWSATAPTYDATNPVTVRARCANDCGIAETADVTSAPEDCGPDCPPVNCINQFGEFTITKRRP